MANEEEKTGITGGRRFRTTRWTQVHELRGNDPSAAAKALSQLCQDYWYPLYAFIRQRGYEPPDAQDLTQGFFARVVEEQVLEQADPSRGRFRTFLLGCLKNFLSHEWNKQLAGKRGGGCSFLSWEELGAEDRLGREPFHQQTPERLFDQRWALTVIDKALGTLQRECEVADQSRIFAVLQPFLSQHREGVSYRDVAAGLGLTENAVKIRVHRLRRRFGQLLRAEVAETVVDPNEVDSEMRDLFQAWG